MAVYSKTATPEQRAWMETYEATTTFEAQYQDELDSGDMTFEQLADANVRWFEEWASDALLTIPRNYRTHSEDEDEPVPAAHK